MGNLAARIVEFCRRRAVAVALFYAVLAVVAAYYAATRLSIDTDLNKLISSDVPWRQQERAFNEAFPQNTDLLAIVIDGATPDETSDATAALADRLAQRPDLFTSIRIPGSGDFFARNGLLFLPTPEVQDFADQLIAAQPLLGTLAVDPSLAGVFGTLDLLAQGALHGDVPAASLDGPFNAVADATESALKGRYAPLSWQTLLSGRSADPRELRHFILVQPVLDYDALRARRARDPRDPRASERLGPDARARRSGAHHRAMSRSPTISSPRCRKARASPPRCRSACSASGCSSRCARSGSSARSSAR